eukprot:evm.model.scf_1417.2 EVM.evm.TU.scf_1417.2   scf_1417:21041-29177(+)
MVEGDVGNGAPVRAVAFVIWDLDGTILDTESTHEEAVRTVLDRRGVQLAKEHRKYILGTRALDGLKKMIEIYGLEDTPEQLLSETDPIVRARWSTTPLMPGALRLLNHLRDSGVPMALATSTSRKYLDGKLQGKGNLLGMFQTTVCGDEVPHSKPAPDVFLEAARKLGADPGECVVLEDSPLGVEGACRAGMRVVMIPSSIDKSECPEAHPEASSGVVQVLSSLLDFRPQKFGLPEMMDMVCGTVPVKPVWCIKGPVVKGFGRGSKELGIPTANLNEQSIGASLSDAVTGIYYGWASVGASPEVYQMVMSIGWNPFYKNEKKTAEPWLLHEFPEDFYDEELRLVVCGYIRPEADFVSLDALIAAIHHDADIARAALAHQDLLHYKSSEFLRPST